MPDMTAASGDVLDQRLQALTELQEAMEASARETVKRLSVARRSLAVKAQEKPKRRSDQ